VRLGVLDIGSNTVHLLLIDAHPGAHPIPFASFKRPLQLVSYLDEKGAISAVGQRKLVSFVSDAVEFGREHEVEDLLAFATSAIRESSNGATVLANVRSATGIQLNELSGPEEAAATFLAVRRWYGWGSGTILNLDIGGGSFELAIGADEQPDLAISVPLGAGRLTLDLLAADPPSAGDVRDARRYARDTLAAPIAKFSRVAAPTIVAGTSKSFRSLARITGAAPRAAGMFVQRELHLQDLTLWATRLSAMTSEDRANLPGVSALRANQMLAAALVAEAAMEGLGVETLRICPWALREGLILRRFDHLQAA
jgi:exopolyphosphatase / guanosine-5'-triphosphate,3'-diphosphate pyrophosphatase